MLSSFNLLVVFRSDSFNTADRSEVKSPLVVFFSLLKSSTGLPILFSFRASDGSPPAASSDVGPKKTQTERPNNCSALRSPSKTENPKKPDLTKEDAELRTSSRSHNFL